MGNWLEQLDKKELMLLVPHEAVGDSPDNGAMQIYLDLASKKLVRPLMIKATLSTRPPTSQKPLYKRYYNRIQKELYILFCTDDAKYARFRQFDTATSKGTLAFVGAISGVIADSIGMKAVVCAPFIANALLAMVAVGTNAWCGVIDDKPKRKTSPRKKSYRQRH